MSTHPDPPRSRRAAGLLRDLLAVASLWSLVLVFFWEIALAGRVLAGGDVLTYFYPYWAEATRAMQAGRLPLWNTYLFMGAPFLANSQPGCFYPLNWPLWLLLPAHQSIHLTIVLHLCLAALNGYMWGRISLRLSPVAAWAVGAGWTLGGYLGSQIEHVNQLQGLAWLPLMLTWVDLQRNDEKGGPIGRLKSSGLCAGLAIIVALVLLAGHTQTAFISLVGLAAYGLGPASWQALRWRTWKPLARRAWFITIAVGLGLALAAAQLLPAYELTRLSVRAGGLPFRERVSFSLSPFYLARALMPAFADPVIPAHAEHVAYVGIAGLTLVAIALCSSRLTFRQRAASSRPTPLGLACLLAILGLFLALGLYNPFYLLLARIVPGFAHFRVPARWLALHVLGMAALMGLGVERLLRHRAGMPWRGLLVFAAALSLLSGWAIVGVRIGEGGLVDRSTMLGWAMGSGLALGLLLVSRRAPRLAAGGLLVLLLVELLAASTTLPHSRATAPQAFTSLRPAIAHLLASSLGEEPPTRFISMSDITFDPGDLSEIEIIYGPQLPASALYDYIIATKQKEILSPNVPLAFGIPAADGFDGGILPLARYVTLQRLFLPEEDVSIDGRLRENLTAIPAARWLSLFNIRHIITDKLHDAWLDDVFYDLQFGAQLEEGEAAVVSYVPQFEATALGLVSYLQGGNSLPTGTLVGTVEIGFSRDLTRTFELRAGEHTAEGLYGPNTAHTQITADGHFWPGVPEGNDYATRLRWEEPASPIAIVVRATLPEGELVVRGASLVDERTGGFQALVLSDQGRFRLAHSGDVKIYENLDVLGRAFLVHEATVADDEAALALMRDASFDPAVAVVLSPDEGAEPLLNDPLPHTRESARVTRYAAERVEVDVQATAPAYLVLSDAWYPGWEAEVDGKPAAIYRADLLFRAVAVDPGAHHVTFTFRPASLRAGAAISLAGALLLGGLLAGCQPRKRPPRARFVQSRTR